MGTNGTIPKYRKPDKWQSLLGDFDFDPAQLRFRGGTTADSNTQELIVKNGIALCDLRFGGGQISMVVQGEMSTENASAQFILNHDARTTDMLTAGIVGQGSEAWYAIQDWTRSRGWDIHASTSKTKRDPLAETALRVEVNGSIVDLFADGIHVLRHLLNIRLPVTQCGVFARGDSSIVFRDFQVLATGRKAFVVMQYSEPYNLLYEQVIAPISNEFHIDAKRADETFGPGVILADIMRQIQESDLIIAEVTPNNANVFYEVGYAHALNKPTILIAEKGKQLPFDLSPFRTLFYENSIAGKQRIESGLREHIKAIVSQ